MSHSKTQKDNRSPDEFIFIRKEKVVCWLSHAIVVKANSQEEAESLVSSLPDTPIKADDNVRIVKTVIQDKDKSILQVIKNEYQPTVMVATPNLRPVFDNAGNITVRAHKGNWEEIARQCLENCSLCKRKRVHPDVISGFVDNKWDPRLSDQRNIQLFGQFAHDKNNGLPPVVTRVCQKCYKPRLPKDRLDVMICDKCSKSNADAL